jgi:hypothetical protein
VFTPLLNNTETSLQFSENISPFLVFCIYTRTDVISKETLIGIRRSGHIIYMCSVGDKTEPCGTLACISLGINISPSTEILNFLLEGKELISFIRLIENFNLNRIFQANVS